MHQRVDILSKSWTTTRQNASVIWRVRLLGGQKHLCEGQGRRRESGFTLIEVTIALLILTVALLGLASMVIAVIKYGDYSKKRTIAITLAHNKMEEIKRMALTTPLTDADNSIESNLDENGVAGEGIFTRTVTITGGAGQLTLLTVTVTWRDTTTHAVTYRTLINQ